jgi:hypothetical protein
MNYMIAKYAVPFSQLDIWHLRFSGRGYKCGKPCSTAHVLHTGIARRKSAAFLKITGKGGGVTSVAAATDGCGTDSSIENMGKK